MNGKISSHKNLVVWQKPLDLVEMVYCLTKTFPHDELYGLISQMRRSVIAIPTNITEGYQRHHLKEYIQFLYISKGSASELETHLIIAKRLGFITTAQAQETEDLLTEILKMLSILIGRFKMKISGRNYN